MHGGPFAAAVLAIFGVAFVIVGFLSLPVCGGGSAYFWFGLAVVAFGASAWAVGGVTALWAGLLIGLILIGVGVGVSYHACGGLHL